MSYLFWLTVLFLVTAYMTVVGDTMLKIKSQLSTILLRLPPTSRRKDTGITLS